MFWQIAFFTSSAVLVMVFLYSVVQLSSYKENLKDLKAQLAEYDEEYPLEDDFDNEHDFEDEDEDEDDFDDENDGCCLRCDELFMELMIARHSERYARRNRVLVYQLILFVLVLGAVVVYSRFQSVLECIGNAV